MHNPNIVNSNSNIVNSNSDIVKSNSQVILNIGNNTLPRLFYKYSDIVNA